MYRITCDGSTLYDPNNPVLQIISGSLKTGINQAGTLTLVFSPSHPYLDKLKVRASVVTVYRDGAHYFCGSPISMDIDDNNVLTVTIEGALAWLNDSIQPHTVYHDISLRGYLETLVQNHNTIVDEWKHFTVGTVTVEDSNDSLYRFSNFEHTKDAISDKLVQRLGGYLYAHKTNNVLTLDYLADFQHINTQGVHFGRNLLTYANNLQSSDLATAIIPLGCKLKAEDGSDTDERLQIDNNGKNYVWDAEAVAQYGWIFEAVIYDDVTLKENLLARGYKELNTRKYLPGTIKLTAVDFGALDGSYERISVGDLLPVVSKPHGVDTFIMVSEMTEDLVNPGNSSVVLNRTYKTMTDGILGGRKQTEKMRAESITGVTVLYAQSTSETVAPASGWNAAAPSREDGKYIWQKTLTLYGDGHTAESEPSCMSGADGQPGQPGEKGETGQAGIGIKSVTEEYYLSTSKTTQTGGTWLATPPQWVSGKYLWIRTVITYTDNSAVRTEPVCDSSWEAAGNVEDKINSRGQQLVTNGSGALGDNTNFSRWTFDGATANNSPGSFLRGATGTVETDEFFPIDVNLKYRLDFDAKTQNSLSTLYSMIVFYDVDKNPITAVHNMYFPDTLTELTQDLKNGDTVVHLKSLENWNKTATQTYQRKFVFWNYKNSKGYTYPPLTYSRNLSVTDAYADENVNIEAGTITLRAPWSGGIIPAGTKLSQSNSGSGYKYIGVVGAVVPNAWKHYTGTIAGVDCSGINKSGMFPPGTAYGRAGWLWNYNSAADTTWITNVSVCEDVKSDIESIKQTFTDYKTEIKLNLDNITSSVTETQETVTTTTKNIYDEVGNLRDTTITEEQLTEVQNSLVEQYSDLIEMRFTSVKDLVDELEGTVENKQSILEQYIRFEGAMIELGRSDSALIAKLSNDKLAFLENGQEVAYISNLKMYITDAQINRTLSFGDQDTGYYTWTIGESGTYDLEYMEG